MSKKNYFVVLLIIIGFLVYANSLFNGFVWDDEEQILNNTLVHSIKNLPLFFKGGTFNTGGTGSLTGVYYRPLMVTFFSFLYQLFGPTPFVFHFFQIALHVVNTLLVFFLLTRLLDSKNNPQLPFFLALIFLVHPANVETVAYISAVQDVFYVFFGLLALYLIIKGGKTFRTAVLASSALFLALLAKEVAFIFMLLISVYHFLFKKMGFVNYLVFFILITVAYLVMRFGLASVFFTPYHFAPIVQMSLSQRILMLPAIFFYYLQLFLFPKSLAVMQHWVIKDFNFINFYFPLLILVLFFSLNFFYLFKTRNKLFLFFFLWFILGLFPYLQLFPLDMTVAERWFYFPMIGLLGMIGIIILNIKYQILKRVAIVFSLIVISLLSIRTVVRNFDWKNGLILFSHDIKISKNAFDLENNLGVELFRVKKFDGAKIHFERSTQLAPNWWTNWNNLGVVYEKKGDLNKAKQYYQKAIDNGDYYLAYENLAIILIKQKKFKEAQGFLEKDALLKFPNNERLQSIYSYLNQPTIH